jgi:hypothetical protein
VNGVCNDLSTFIVRQAKGWSLVTRAIIGGATIDLSAVFNPDPGISFSGATLNPTPEALTYSFLFGTPIVPDVYSEAISSVQFTATSAQGTTTVDNSEVRPTYVAGYGSNGETLTNLGVDAGTAPCVASGIAATSTCAAEGATFTFAPMFFDNLEALVTYTQDNALSSATFGGQVAVAQVTTTPEPGSAGLLGIGLFAIAGAASSRRLRRNPA